MNQSDSLLFINLSETGNTLLCGRKFGPDVMHVDTEESFL